MDNEAFELDWIENGHPSNGKLAHEALQMENDLHPNGMSNGKGNGKDGAALVPNGGPRPQDEESRRFDAVRDLASTGNGPKLEALLMEWEELGWLRDWRNEDGLTLYADAVTDGYIDVINSLLKHDIPLGDALIRAIEADFGDAVESMCRYLRRRKDLCASILKGNCDNDDFHPAITPLLLAAQRNNFDSVQLLVELGAKIIEPSLCLGDDVTLSQATCTLQIYRGLSQPAYILNTETDVFGHAFKMSKRLRILSVMWEDFGAEYEEMAKAVDVFAGEMLGQSGSTEEILALFRYHTNDKYRDSEGMQHPLSKMFEAIKYEQKEFIAHPHSQKAIIAQFYQNLLSWNEKGLFHQILLTLLVLFGYPIICLLYILFPFPKVVNFARLPYVMMLMKAGSGFTFLAMLIIDVVLNKYDYPTTIVVIRWLIIVWILGLMWLHMKVCMRKGAIIYVSDSANLHEIGIIALFLAVFVLQWNGKFNMANYPFLSRLKREAVNGTFLNNNSYSELQDHVTLTLDGLHGKLNGTVVGGVNRVVMDVLSGCRPLIPTTDAPIPTLPPKLKEAYELDPYDPAVVAESLLGIAIVVSFLRLLNLTLVSDVLGPLRISLGAMTNDFAKFFGVFSVIWFSFAVGLHQTLYSAGVATERQCLSEGGDPDVCSGLTGFSTVLESMYNLYWALFGKVGLQILVIPGHHNVAEIVTTALFLCYHIIAVLILLNSLIGMLSNTYNGVEEQADTEWKFNRAAVWANYLQPVGTLPPPFNLIPSAKTVFRFLRFITGFCARPEVESKKALHSKREFEDYLRVMKLTSSRYVQGNLSASALNSEGVRPRDLQTLRNEVMAFRFMTESRLDQIDKSLGTSNEKSIGISKKLEDLVPLDADAKELLGQMGDLTSHTQGLGTHTDDVDVEQNEVILIKDTTIAELTAKLAALHTENDEMVVTHTAQNLEHDRQAAMLSETINILQNERSTMTINLSGLSDDKERLAAEVDKLNQEVRRLDALRPAPNDEEEPDGSPEPKMKRNVPEPDQSSPLGFIARIKKSIGEVLNEGSGDSSTNTNKKQILSGHGEPGASQDNNVVVVQATSPMPIHEREVDEEQMKGSDGQDQAKQDPEKKPDATQIEPEVNKRPRSGIVKRISDMIEDTLSKNKKEEDSSATTPGQEPGSDGKLQQQSEQSLRQDELPGSSLESDVDQQAKPQDEAPQTNLGPDGKLQSADQEDTPEQQGTEPDHSEKKLEAEEHMQPGKLQSADQEEAPEQQGTEPDHSEKKLQAEEHMQPEKLQSADQEEAPEQQGTEPDLSEKKSEADEHMQPAEKEEPRQNEVN